MWLNLEFAPTPPMLVKARSDRGLQNMITGRLLCPIEHRWEDEQYVCIWLITVVANFFFRVRSAIQAGSLDISEDFFLRCLYPHGNGDPRNVEKGFLRSKLLLKVTFAFRYSFICLCFLCRHTVQSLRHLRLPRHLTVKMKMVQPVNNKGSIHKRRPRRATWQPFYIWKVELRRGLLLMPLSW